MVNDEIDVITDELIDEIIDEAMKEDGKEQNEVEKKKPEEDEAVEEKKKEKDEKAVEIHKEKKKSKSRKRQKNKAPKEEKLVESEVSEKKKKETVDEAKKPEKEEEVKPAEPKEDVAGKKDEEVRKDEVEIVTYYDELSSYREAFINALRYSDSPLQVDDYIAVASEHHLEQVGESGEYYRIRNTGSFFQDIKLASTNFNVAMRYAKHLVSMKKIVLIVLEKSSWKIMVHTKLPFREMPTAKGLVLV